MRRGFWTLIAAMLVLVMATVGCAKVPPNTSPEGTLAIRGRQVMIAADGVLTGVDTLVQNQQLKPADAVKVVLVIRRIGQEGQRLADALAIIDATKDQAAKVKGISQAVEILKMIQSMVTEAVIPISDEGARKQVSQLLQSITNLVIGLVQFLPAPAAG